MPEQPGAGRLDPETLAAYIDGLLPPEERARVEDEIAADPETYEWVVNTIGAVDDPAVAAAVEPVRDVAPSPKPNPAPNPAPNPDLAPADGSGHERKVLPFYRRRGFIGTVGMMAAAAAALVVVLLPSDREADAERRMEAIVQAVGSNRYVGVRLSGAFPVTAGRPVLRGAPRASAPNLQLRAAAAQARRAASEVPSPRLLHAAGVGMLLEGTDLDGAIDALERAARADDAVSVRSDLFAALVEAFQRTRDELVFRRAESLARTMLEGIAPPEFLYNFAYLLELRGDYQRAVAAWEDYLSSVRGSGWEAEARSRLEAVKVLAEGRP